jgi:hypothetical protein
MPGGKPIEGPWKGRTTNGDSGKTLEPSLRAKKSPGPAAKSKELAGRTPAVGMMMPVENMRWKSIQGGQRDREPGAREIPDSSSRSFGLPLPASSS